MRYADLHLHTQHSDGTRTPREVIDLARQLDLGIVAISDHDNLGGYFEIRSYASEQNVTLIAATELSTLYDGVDIHLLAYAFDPTDERLNARIESFRNTRYNRGMAMVEKLRGHGIAISSQRVAELAGGGSVGRPHVARALIEAGHVTSFEEAFDRYLTAGKPGYVDKERFRVEEAVDLVHRAGGVLSIAHPSIYPDHRRIVDEVLDRGVDAVEVFHPQVPDDDRDYYERVCSARGLFVTGGSDDHGKAKTKETIGTIRVEESRIGRILERS